MEIDWREIRRGLRATRAYLLSHHPPGERNRCHTVRVRGRGLRLCARCCGVYPGIALGVAAGTAIASPMLALIAFCPLPALVDWALTAFTADRGSNGRRTATGLLLGLGYGLGLVSLLQGRLEPVPIGLAYGVVAGTALYISAR